MNRIRKLLRGDTRHKMLVPFLTAGYPSLSEAMELVSVAEASGADMVEIGLPFSDPLADGPEIQFSSHQALAGGISTASIFDQVQKARQRTNIPIVFMGYYNPLLARGQERFLADTASAGVDGLIIPDLPVEEGESFKKTCDSHDLSTIFLVAPTTSEARIRKIDRFSTGFVYAVTVTGVTGTGKVFDRSTDNYLKKLRSILKNRFVAGFGVSSADNARRLVSASDGVVIGSAIVKIIRDSKNKKERRQRIEKFLTSIRKAIG